jgi:hypothetical protein
MRLLSHYDSSRPSVVFRRVTLIVTGDKVGVHHGTRVGVCGTVRTVLAGITVSQPRVSPSFFPVARVRATAAKSLLLHQVLPPSQPEYCDM